MFESIVGAVFLPDGGIAVADQGFATIRIFDSTGVFVEEVGQSGQGPGEFTELMAIWLTSQGQLAAWDPGTRRITLFTDRGDLVGTRRVEEGGGGNLEVFFGAFEDTEPVLASLNFGDRSTETVPDPWVVARFGLNGSFKAHMGHVRGMWRFDRQPVPFSPMPWVAVVDDTLFVADGYQPALSVRDVAGRRVREIMVPLRRKRATSNVWRSLRDHLAARGSELELDILSRGAVPQDARLPAIGGLLKDDEGLLWVKQYEPLHDSIWLKTSVWLPGPGGSWVVINPTERRTVATVDMPSNTAPFHITRDRLLGLATDEWGVQRIVVHTIERN